MKFVSACFRRYRRIFEKFLHRDWDLVEILQKLSKTFFLKFFSTLKKWVNIAFFVFWVKIFQHFLIDAAEILSFWVEMGAYSTRKWRKNRKIRRYRRERAEAKLRFFWSFSLKENDPNLHEHNLAKSAQNQPRSIGSHDQGLKSKYTNFQRDRCWWWRFSVQSVWRSTACF